MKKKCAEKLVYYLSLLTVVVVLAVVFLEIATTFSLVENLFSSRILLYFIYSSSALFIPLILLSSLLVFKSRNTPYGKKSIKLLVNVGITYATIKIILVVITLFKFFDSGVF